jgi:hypothetical protein
MAVGQARHSAEAPDTAVLDLRERSMARGQSQADAGQAPLEISRTTKRLVLDLPIEARRTYDVGLLTKPVTRFCAQQGWQ